MISSANAEKLTTVQRQRALFSLCKNHGFKKYPVKLLMLALLDISLTNATRYFKLCWKDSDCPNSRMSHADFLQDIAEKLISSNREWELEDNPGIKAILGFNTDFSPESNSSIHSCFKETYRKALQ